ncbi:MGDG synthase family glycosyltransferase [Bacillus sp. Marseille-P3661]|uniref:MGDG synthase family glycosyltransferase n=1 Tax=Bacillus sp. Marseille-P3661 TaxID=1936234 RepID=UPI000C81DB81|nr:UDP-glucuronosyltransferase [Bacillus sp. Marseille-P3661]
MDKALKSKVLFLPFLQIPSGHHKVAESIMEGLYEIEPNLNCEKVEILSYSYGNFEKFVSAFYLKWIKTLPAIYHWIYKNQVYNNIDKNKRYRLYECLFLKFMKKLITQKSPDLIVCTHALPAYLLNLLKQKEQLSIPVINIYTDYFIHQFWGTSHIEYHFVPSNEMKQYLLCRGVDPKRIFVTGIPIHTKIKKQKGLSNVERVSAKLNILITGGNLGVGKLETLIDKIGADNIHYYVLCGKNRLLYRKLKSLRNSYITPLEYIDSRDKMNMLYDQVDAIVTKPGGVTLSECLFKRKPIFIYHALPGQEEINLQQLSSLGIVIHLGTSVKKLTELGSEIRSFFEEKSKLVKYYANLDQYHLFIDSREPVQIVYDILKSKLSSV